MLFCLQVQYAVHKLSRFKYVNVYNISIVKDEHNNNG
jgi:hypothetical protein